MWDRAKHQGRKVKDCRWGTRTPSLSPRQMTKMRSWSHLDSTRGPCPPRRPVRDASGEVVGREGEGTYLFLVDPVWNSVECRGTSISRHPDVLVSHFGIQVVAMNVGDIVTHGSEDGDGSMGNREGRKDRSRLVRCERVEVEVRVRRVSPLLELEL